MNSIKDFIFKIFISKRLLWNLNINRNHILRLIEEARQVSPIESIFVPGISVVVRGNRFYLSKMTIGNIPFSGNGFTHIVSGIVQDTPTGAEVKATFRLRIPVFIFSLLWLSFAFIGGLIGGSEKLFEYTNSGNPKTLFTSLAFFTFPIIGLLVLNVFRYMAKANEREMQHTLVQICQPYMTPTSSR